MAETVYFLCGLTSLGCALLLLRSWSQRRTRLVLWCALCFVGLAINNALLFADFVLVPTISLALLRSSVATISLLVLLFGLVWDAE
jgi:hypothetical protein